MPDIVVKVGQAIADYGSEVVKALSLKKTAKQTKTKANKQKTKAP